MIFTRYLAVIAATFLLAGTAACQSPPVEAGICQGPAAAALAGKDRITDEEAKRLTGATLVRQIRPGDGVTMDYREERVTIETDETTGKIIRASCG